MNKKQKKKEIPKTQAKTKKNEKTKHQKSPNQTGEPPKIISRIITAIG